MRFDLKHELSEGQFNDLMRLYTETTYWAKNRNREDVRKMLTNSDIIFVFADPKSDELIAFARVLTDKTYKALIFDVIVAPDRQGKGLGRALMEAIIEHPDLKDVSQFELYCRPDVIEFYKKWGFSEDLKGQHFMRRTTEGDPGGT